MLKDLSGQAVAAGALSAFVGFASSFAVIIHGLVAVGATQSQAASGLMVLSVAMGVCGIILSLRGRIPVTVAWSTPGAALLATTGAMEGGFGAAVGAFIVCGLLIVAAGLWRPLGRWVSAIPTPLASAMLAGVLLGMCLAPVRAVAEAPLLGLPVVLAWAVMARIKRLYAVPAAVVVAALGIAGTAHLSASSMGPLWPSPVLTMPVITLPAIIGIAVPLFIVTMASQNIPGMAVMVVNGYRADAGLIFRSTGLSSVIAAPFGSHAVCLAAITAAMCAGPDAQPDAKKRYWAAVAAGVMYIVLGLLATAATAFIAAAPPILIEAVAGLALLGAFGGALLGAAQDPASREAAIITFLVTGSGVSLLGIGGAFWGLVAGGAFMLLGRFHPGLLRPRG